MIVEYRKINDTLFCTRSVSNVQHKISSQACIFVIGQLPILSATLTKKFACSNPWANNLSSSSEYGMEMDLSLAYRALSIFRLTRPPALHSLLFEQIEGGCATVQHFTALHRLSTSREVCQVSCEVTYFRERFVWGSNHGQSAMGIHQWWRFLWFM